MDELELGIHVEGEVDGVERTLASLADLDVSPILLADSLAPAELTRLRALAESRNLRVIELRDAGGAGAFAALASAARPECEVLAFVESGAELAPTALPRLLEVLADEDIGMCGPTFDRGWYRQAALRSYAERPLAQAIAAAEALDPTLDDLAPLHALETGCLLVHRRALVRIVGVDLGYGVGPCWEMDLHIRCVRAGLRGVWVPRAFVRRVPASALRRRREQQWFEHSRRRYQDTVCERRWVEPGRPYAAHCEGDGCRWFAPPARIRVRPPQLAPRPAARVELGEPALPLVSCVMPTTERAVLVDRAIELFRRQDWPVKELVIAEEGYFPIGHLRDDPSIRLVRVPRGLDIGSKRNRAIAEARGDILMQWDDDDWYASDRIRTQVEPIVAGEADVSAFVAELFFHVERGEFWSVRPEQRARMFVADVHGGTLAYTRAAWKAAGGYPAASLAEDAALLRAMTRRGHRLARLPNQGRYVYVRHGKNTWTFTSTGAGWTRESAPATMPAGDLAFYEAFARSVLDSPGWSTPTPAIVVAEPLVSCLMPTRDRPAFVAQACRYFARQTWERRELIVVDDGRESIASLLPDDPRIKHVRVAPGSTLGDKRNFACEQARGEILMHWDDDDWHAPWRIHYQVAALMGRRAGLVGVDRLHYLDPWAPEAAVWQYAYPRRLGTWVAGGTFAYTRELWSSLRFRPLGSGEDNDFVARCPPNAVLRLDDFDFYVGIIHPGNTSRKQLGDARWQRQSGGTVWTLIDADRDFYRELPRLV